MVKVAKNIKLRTHKDLIAWQKAYKLCLSVHKMTKDFPRTEQFGLVSQIKRSSLSVPSNIAEGYNRHQTREYIRFLYIAYSSLAELETQLLIAKDLNYIDQVSFAKVEHLHAEVQRILYGLIKSLKS